MMKEFFSKLKRNKIEINWNKNPIKMELFLSFLTVEVRRSHEHMGSSAGWTKLFGDNGLEISGGSIGSVEWLDSLRYGENLDNPYNNFINPFYLFGILNDEGKKFFLEYYADDIKTIVKKAESATKWAQQVAETAKANEAKVVEFWSKLGIEPKTEQKGE